MKEGDHATAERLFAELAGDPEQRGYATFRRAVALLHLRRIGEARTDAGCGAVKLTLEHEGCVVVRPRQGPAAFRNPPRRRKDLDGRLRPDLRPQEVVDRPKVGPARAQFCAALHWLVSPVSKSARKGMVSTSGSETA